MKIIDKPIYCIVQDKGNFHHTHLGISVSGVMDEFAYNIANMLLGNKADTNILEINFANISFKIQKDTTIAITGAKCEFYINGILKNSWQTYHLKKDDLIKIGKFISGLRVYLSVKGGFIVDKEPWGLSNEKLKQGDILDYQQSNKVFMSKRLKKRYIPEYTNQLTLRVILSYQEKDFSQQQKKIFFSSTYTVSTEISRMGYKLKGDKISCDIDGIISEGIAFGSIQIPKDGLPIILLKDRQTIGGYPKIGVVLDIDCYKLSQAKPNTKIIFKQISLKEATNKSNLFVQTLK
jgi:biotin-dependent carboxylase-like uncharacterized protein